MIITKTSCQITLTIPTTDLDSAALEAVERAIVSDPTCSRVFPLVVNAFVAAYPREITTSTTQMPPPILQEVKSLVTTVSALLNTSANNGVALRNDVISAVHNVHTAVLGGLTNLDERQRELKLQIAETVRPTVKSHTLGVIGEDHVYSILSPLHDIEHTGKTGHRGDMIVDKKVLVEVKNYSHRIPEEELKKFRSDLQNTRLPAGLFLSVGPGGHIPGNRQNTTPYRREIIGGRPVHTAYLKTANPEIIETVTCALLAMSELQAQNVDEEYPEDVLDMMKDDLARLLNDSLVSTERIVEVRKCIDAHYSASYNSLNAMNVSLQHIERDLRCNLRSMRAVIGNVNKVVTERVNTGVNSANDIFTTITTKYNIPDNSRESLGLLADHLPIGCWKLQVSECIHPSGIRLIVPKVSAKRGTPVYIKIPRMMFTDGNLGITRVFDETFEYTVNNTHVTMPITSETCDYLSSFLRELGSNGVDTGLYKGQNT